MYAAKIIKTSRDRAPLNSQAISKNLLPSATCPSFQGKRNEEQKATNEGFFCCLHDYRRFSSAFGDSRVFSSAFDNPRMKVVCPNLAKKVRCNYLQLLTTIVLIWHNPLSFCYSLPIQSIRWAQRYLRPPAMRGGHLYIIFKRNR